MDMLLQLYRETKVSLANLLPNKVAMQVVAASLSQRAGRAYSPDDVARMLESVAGTPLLPKLPNDRPFVARNHECSEGKRYERRIQRVRRRRTSRGGGDEEARLLPAV